MEKKVSQPLLEKAILFAARKHLGQVRKGTTIPYLTHVMEAMEIVSRMTEDEELRAAAVLHDTLEDTPTTKDELVLAFGQRVADLVEAESEDKREGRPAEETWLARKQETVRHLSAAGTEIRILALGDKLSNVRSMARDYARIGEELWKKFNNPDPIGQGMYYGLLANAFGKDEFIRATPEFGEYVSLCTGLFGGARDGDGNLIEEDEDDDDDSARPAEDSFKTEFIKDYGDTVCLPDGTKLHDNIDGEYNNYIDPFGGRTLVRCSQCGALMLRQSTCDPNPFDGFEYLDDWIPVASETEADLLNILLSGQEFTAYPFRHYRRVDRRGGWTEGEAPRPGDPEELIRLIREKYAHADEEQLTRLLCKTLSGTAKEDEGSGDLIFDPAEDEDIREIQRMAAALNKFLRGDDTGFGDVRFRITNDPDSDDVSWERTEDGYALHLCARSGKNWCQTAYQLGYLMTRCLIDHLGDGEEGITWAEELIAEAAALKLLSCLERDWERTPFYEEDPGYAAYIAEYISETLSDEGTSAILRCGGREELKAINERDLFEDRIDESHDLYRAMEPRDILSLARIREYQADDLTLHTHYWRRFSNGSAAVDCLCRLQENIPGCDIPSGIGTEIDLRHSAPTDAQMRCFARMIRALEHKPCEYVIFTFLDADKADGEQTGAVFFQVLRKKDGRVMAELRLDTSDGRRMYRTAVDDDEAAAILSGILRTGEAPDVSAWEDITDRVFPG